jgi:hypothetical protein
VGITGLLAVVYLSWICQKEAAVRSQRAEGQSFLVQFPSHSEQLQLLGTAQMLEEAMASSLSQPNLGVSTLPPHFKIQVQEAPVACLGFNGDSCSHSFPLLRIIKHLIWYIIYLLMCLFIYYFYYHIIFVLGVHCDIYKSAYLNSPPLSFFFIPLPPFLE